jgi:RNA polymerase sigma factor (sigma-70 family)
MHKIKTTGFFCRHGVALQGCSICQSSQPYKALAGMMEERIAAARSRLLRLAQLNGIRPDEAEDVVQETCLEAWRHLETLREPERFAAWLDGICRNVCKRHIRANATLLPTSDLSTSEGEAEATEFDLPDLLAIDPAEELERQDMQVLLDRALGHLSQSTRELVELCYLAELPRREVAQRLDMTLGALELKLHRARRQLRQVLYRELRDDAQTFGLLFDEDESMGWQETRQWCFTCGKQRLRGTFERQPSGIVAFRMRCPDCSPRYVGDELNTSELPLVLPMIGTMRSFRPAFKRTLQAAAYFSNIVFGQRRCNMCQSPIRIDIIDLNRPESVSDVPTYWPPSVYLRIVCPNCKTYICEFNSVLLMSQGALTFLLERSRVLYTPATMGTYAGQDAFCSRLLDLTSGERLTIMTHPQTLQIMATLLEK